MIAEPIKEDKAGIVFVHFFFYCYFVLGLVFTDEVSNAIGLSKPVYVVLFTVLSTSAYVTIYILCFYERFGSHRQHIENITKFRKQIAKERWELTRKRNNECRIRVSGFEERLV
jgi:hypothetical protein